MEEIGGLAHLEGREVVVLGDGSPEEGHVVREGKITLRYPARVVQAGLNFRSILAPLPVETDAQKHAGQASGIRKMRSAALSQRGGQVCGVKCGRPV